MCSLYHPQLHMCSLAINPDQGHLCLQKWIWCKSTILVNKSKCSCAAAIDDSCRIIWKFMVMTFFLLCSVQPPYYVTDKYDLSLPGNSA